MDRLTFTPPRRLTERERKVTRWIIEHGDCAKKDYLAQLEEATVVSRCPCGCASVNFAIHGREAPKEEGLTILGDFLCGDETTGLGGIFVFARSGILAGVEIYQLSDKKIHEVLPEIESLKPIAGINSCQSSIHSHKNF